jgi:hypothetical protein
MIFSRHQKEEKQSDVESLEIILSCIEADPNVKKTVIGIYRALTRIREEYFISHSGKKEKDGMIVYTNHQNPQLEINNLKEAKYMTEPCSVHEKIGKKKLEELMYENYAIETDAQTGNIASYCRHIIVNPKEVAIKRGLIKENEDVSSELLGFRADIRKHRSHNKNSSGIVGTRHINGKSATGVDPHLYVFVISRETGDINVFHDYKTIYSTIKEEIDPVYKQYLTTEANNTPTTTYKRDESSNLHPKVQEAREMQTISREEALRLQLAILHEHKIAHHYI